MKRAKIVISLFLALSILTVSVLPTLAESVTALDDEIVVLSVSKISAELLEKMEAANENERIPVWVWYKDIDQDDVDELTSTRVGYTAEECGTATLDYQKVFCSTGDRIAVDDNSEQELTQNYIDNRRKVSTEKYTVKSQRIIANLQIEDQYIIFKSQFAPLIIAKLTTNEIQIIVNNNEIISLSVYHTPLNYIDSLDSKSEALMRSTSLSTYNRMVRSMGLNEVYDKLNIHGSGVRIGLIEGNLPGIYIDDSTTYNEFEFDSHNLLNIIYNYETQFNTIDSYVESKINEFQQQDSNDLKVVVLVDEDYEAWTNIQTSTSNAPRPHHHANNSVRLMVGEHTGYVKEAVVFATLTGGHGLDNADELVNIEALIKCNVSIIEYNIEQYYRDNSPDCFTDLMNYIDHLVDYHNVTVVVPSGNHCESSSPYGEWVNPLALSYNCISVGAYKVYINGITQELIETRENFKWKNNDISGLSYCAKPDVLLPDNYENYIGTSYSSPSMAAIIALLVNLKPSLALQPHVIKAIVLASCHRKAAPNELSNEEPKDMYDGITDYQGAGIPDAWIMMQIVIQHTYSSGQMNSNSTLYYNITTKSSQQYDMNISISWLRNTSATGSHFDMNNFTGYPIRDLNMYYLNDSDVKSELEVSSTEMNYLTLLQGEITHRFLIENSSPYTVDKLALAWSTSDREKELNRIELSGFTAVGQTLSVQAYCNDGTLTPVNAIDYQWYRSVDGINWTIIPNTNMYTYALTSNDWLKYIKCVATANNSSIVASGAQYNETDMCVVIYGDADLNGLVSIFDASHIYKYLQGIVSLTDEEFLAADVNRDGEVTMLDGQIIQLYLAGSISSLPVEN